MLDTNGAYCWWDNVGQRPQTAIKTTDNRPLGHVLQYLTDSAHLHLEIWLNHPNFIF
jgi:hypothetical protein